MKKFNSWEELKSYIGTEKWNDKYLDEELANFQECVGSDCDPFPIHGFDIELNGTKIEIGVTHHVAIEEDDEVIKYFYWVF